MYTHSDKSEAFKRKWWNYRIFKGVSGLAIAFMLIGLLFKLLSWPHTGEIIMFSMTMYMVIGAWYFVVKTPKTAIDVLKLTARVILPIALVIKLFSWPAPFGLTEIFNLLGNGSVLILLVLFIFERPPKPSRFNTKD